MNKKRKREILYTFIFWLILSTITAVAFYYKISIARWIDIPTHFFAGMVTAAIFFTRDKISRKKKILIASVVFIGWEFIEVLGSNYFSNEFYVRLFEETLFNQIRDLSMDYTGFMAYFLIFEKKRKREVVKVEIAASE